LLLLYWVPEVLRVLEIGHIIVHLPSHHCSLTLALCTCSFLASFQQMSMDEKAAQIIARVVEGKLLLWPQTLGSSPQPMTDQSYILSHAGFVKVSTSVGMSLARLLALGHHS
jgi:hypothetical protein